MTLTSIFLLAVLALAASGAYRVVKRFRATDPSLSLWQRLLATAMGSASVLWNGAVAVGGGIMSYSVLAADGLNAPEVGTFIQSNLNPKYLGLVVFAIGAIGVLARLRTLWSAWRAQGAA
jgi:hypothetical protein